MRHTSARHLVRVAVRVAAVLAQIALAFYYVGLPILVVPGSAPIALLLLWAVELAAVIWLAIRHTWIAPLVPVASFIAVKLIYAYGDANLGWGA